MKDEIIEHIQQETKTGIIQIISKIFSVILEPILDLIESGINKIKKNYEEKQTLKQEANIVSSHLLNEYLADHNWGIILHLQHNHSKSDAGKEFRFVKCHYTNLIPKKRLMERFLEKSQPSYMYNNWMFYCLNDINFETPSQFDKQMKYYFTEETKWVYFRHWRDALFLICSETTEPPTSAQEKEILVMLDNILSPRRKRRSRRK